MARFPTLRIRIEIKFKTWTSLFLWQGFVMNLQPSEAQAGFDIRVPPTADQASLERLIADEWAPASRNMTFEVLEIIIIHRFFF